MERDRPGLRQARIDERMDEGRTRSIREIYDRLADEYARRRFYELEHKPLDRELLNRFAAKVAGQGEVCDRERHLGVS